MCDFYSMQESPVHALSIVTSLLLMAGKKSKRESVIAIGKCNRPCNKCKFVAPDALKELWLNCLLPDSRKLKHIRQVCACSCVSLVPSLL